MESSKDEALKRIQKQTAMYHLFRSYAQVEGDKLKEIVARLVDDIAPCKAGDYVRTPEGYVYKIEAVHLLFENDQPDAFYFQCEGAPVMEDETLGPVESLVGPLKVIQRVERPISFH